MPPSSPFSWPRVECVDCLFDFRYIFSPPLTCALFRSGAGGGIEGVGAADDAKKQAILAATAAVSSSNDSSNSSNDGGSDGGGTGGIAAHDPSSSSSRCWSSSRRRSILDQLPWVIMDIILECQDMASLYHIW